MREPTRLGLPLVVLAAVLLPACGSDTGTIPDVPAAGIVVTVDPNPVPPSQDPFSGIVSIGYRVTITEINGLGGDVQFVSGQVYDPTNGQLRNQTYFDSADLIVFVGSKRVEALDSLVVPQTLNYTLPEGRVNALLAVNVQLKDDRENLINSSLLVRVEPPLAPTP